jgi:hypothetical protein
MNRLNGMCFDASCLACCRQLWVSHPILRITTAYFLDMSSPVSQSSAAAPAAEMPYPEFLRGPYALAMTETSTSNNTVTPQDSIQSAVHELSPAEDAYVPLWVRERQREQAIYI